MRYANNYAIFSWLLLLFGRLREGLAFVYCANNPYDTHSIHLHTTCLVGGNMSFILDVGLIVRLPIGREMRRIPLRYEQAGYPLSVTRR